MGKFDRLRKKWIEERRERAARSEAVKAVLRERGEEVFRRHGVEKAILFGSVADGRCGPRSDADLLALPLDGEAYWACRRDLEEATGLAVDLYTQADDAAFVSKVLQRGEVVYEVSPGISQGRHPGRAGKDRASGSPVRRD